MTEKLVSLALAGVVVPSMVAWGNAACQSPISGYINWK